MKLIIILTFLSASLMAQTNGPLAVVQDKAGGTLLTNAVFQFKFGNRAFFREEETGRVYGFRMDEVHTNLLAKLKLNPADGEREQAAIDAKKKEVADAYVIGDALAAESYEQHAEERKKQADADAEKRKSALAKADQSKKQLADTTKERQGARASNKSMKRHR